MTMDMSKDKETLLSEYSDEIARVIAKMYLRIQEKQDNSITVNLADEGDEYIVDEKTFERTSAQLSILMELANELDATFPQYMATSCIMDEEGVEES